jgi:PAS domain S-box-containing protein
VGVLTTNLSLCLSLFLPLLANKERTSHAFLAGVLISALKTSVAPQMVEFTIKMSAKKQIETDQLSIHELEAVGLSALHLTSELQLDQLLGEIIKRSRELLDADAGGLYRYYPEEQLLRVEFYSGIGPTMLGKTLRLGDGLAGKVVESGEPIAVDNYNEWESRSKVLDNYPFRAVIGVPLVAQNRKLGAIYLLNYDEKKRFKTRDAKLLAVLANHAAVALMNATIFQEHRRTLRQLELLNRLNERLNHAVDINEILQITLEESLKAVNTTDGSVMVVDDVTGELEIKAWVVRGKRANSKDHKRFARNEGVASQVVTSGLPYNCTDTSKSDLFVPSFTNRKIGALLSVPILLHQRVFCIINTDSNKIYSFTEQDVKTLTDLACHVAIAIESQLLRNVGVSLSALPLKELFPAIVKSAAQLTGSGVSTIFLRDETSGSIDRAACYPSSIKSSDEETKGDSLTQRILKRGRLVQLTGWRLSKLARPEVLDRGVKSLLGAPLTVRLDDQVKTLGVLFVSTTRAKHYEKRDEAILQSLANQAAVVIEQTRNVDELQENALFRDSLLQNAFDAIVAVNEDGTVRLCNQSAQKILGISEADAIGKPVANFFLSPDVAERLHQTLKNKGRVLREDTDVKNQTGEAIPIRLSCIQLEKGSVGFFQDRRELESAKRNVEQLKKLIAAGQAVTKLTDQAGVLETAVQKSIETLKADIVCLFSYDETAEKIVPTPICSRALSSGANHAEMFSLSAVDAIRIKKDIYCVADTRKDRLFKSSTAHTGIFSLVAGPLRIREKTVGVIFCGYRDPRSFSDEEKAMMRVYFNGVAVAIENARLYDEVNQRAKVIQGLYRAGMAHLLGSEPLQHLRSWLDQVRQVTNASYAVMEVQNSESDLQPTVISSGESPPRSNSQLEEPILLGDQAVGKLKVSHKQRASSFNGEDSEYLHMLAGSAAMMTELSRLRERAGLIQSTDIAFLLLCRWARLMRKKAGHVRSVMESSNGAGEWQNQLLTDLTALLTEMDSPLEPKYASVANNFKSRVDIGALLKKSALKVGERLLKAAVAAGAGEASGTPVTKNIQPNCIVLGNSLLLELAIDILLDNAVGAIEKKRERPVYLRLECSAHDDLIDVLIVDSGTGVAHEITKDLFKFPLNRADGLGYGALTVGMICRVHKGTVRVKETGDQGTTLRLTLPAN